MFLLTQLLWFSTPHSVGAEEWSRAGRFELFLFGQGMAEDQAHETVGGVRVTSEVDDFIAYGIGGGYHINDYLSVNVDLFGASTDLKVSGGALTLKEDSDVSGLDLNIDLFPFPGRFSPFVTAGIGYVTFFEDIDDDDDCYCYYDADEFSSEFSFNAGAGIRWDFSDHLFVKALYRATWTDLEDTNESFKFHGFSMFAGYLF
jgi:opacity protein-like surface antigen